MWENVRGSWKDDKPKGFYRKLWTSRKSQPYRDWRFPKGATSKLNTLLTETRSLSDGPSLSKRSIDEVYKESNQLVYGLGQKNKDGSGRHVLSGLTRILAGVEESKDPKAARLSKRLRSFIGNYFIDFNPKHAKK